MKMFDRSNTIASKDFKQDLNKKNVAFKGLSSSINKFEKLNSSLSNISQNNDLSNDFQPNTLKENSNAIFNRGYSFRERLNFVEKSGEKPVVKETKHVKKFSDVNNSYIEEEENFLKNALKSLRSSENVDTLNKSDICEKVNPLRKSIKITNIAKKLERHILNGSSNELNNSNLESNDDYENMISGRPMIKNVKKKMGKKGF